MKWKLAQFQSFLVSCFLVSSFFVFEVSWIQSFKASKIQHSFDVFGKNSIQYYQQIVSCFFINIDFVFKLFKKTIRVFFDRSIPYSIFKSSFDASSGVFGTRLFQNFQNILCSKVLRFPKRIFSKVYLSFSGIN